ncbi:MAG: hypothetical protein ACYTBJ_26885 [Planctomycetota bacterium]|jgi:hypothetical protein
MFRALSIIVFLVTIAAIALHRVIRGSSSRTAKQQAGGILRGLVCLLTLLFLEQRLSLLGRLKKLAYLLGLLCFAVLAVTGFWPVLVLGRHICGYLLMVHVTFGGVFAVCLFFLAVTWAHSYGFNESDWPWLTSLVRREMQKHRLLGEDPNLLRKICFWLLLLVSLPLMRPGLSGEYAQVLCAGVCSDCNCPYLPRNPNAKK